MIMAVKEVLVLWTATLLAASAQNLVNDSNKTLANIPSNYDVNITGLILDHNHITMNNSDIQALRNYSNLTELDLSYNLIEQLPDGAFSALGSLETLRLTGNKLQTIRCQTFKDLKKLKTLDMSLNPWNCTQELLKLVRWMNDTGRQIGPNVTCATPENLSGQRILDAIPRPPATHDTVTATKTTSTFTKSFTTVQSSQPQESSTLSSQNISSKDTKSGNNNNSWKFLTGVIVIILCTSMFIMCAVKSPTWYKILFDYRHQRLHETEDPGIFNTGRYSNFSLDTEQTETSAHELDQGLTGPSEDEDGFIEDGYIQPEDYKEHSDVGGV